MFPLRVHLLWRFSPEHVSVHAKHWWFPPGFDLLLGSGSLRQSNVESLLMLINDFIPRRSRGRRNLSSSYIWNQQLSARAKSELHHKELLEKESRLHNEALPYTPLQRPLQSCSRACRILGRLVFIDTCLRLASIRLLPVPIVSVTGRELALARTRLHTRWPWRWHCTAWGSPSCPCSWSLVSARHLAAAFQPRGGEREASSCSCSAQAQGCSAYSQQLGWRLVWQISGLANI